MVACRSIGTFLLCAVSVVSLTSCGASGPVKATKAIKSGERFYNNWEGSKIGDKDNIILLSSYASRNIAPGQEIKPQDIAQAVNVDVEWLKNTSFTATKTGLKLKTLPSCRIKIERNGKSAGEGEWTLDSGVDSNSVVVQLPRQPKIEFFGATGLVGKRRFLVSRIEGAAPELWLEDLARDSKSFVSSGKATKLAKRS
jgi:hypothetical protein